MPVFVQMAGGTASFSAEILIAICDRSVPEVM
jgi:hypothetical protein